MWLIIDFNGARWEVFDGFWLMANKSTMIEYASQLRIIRQLKVYSMSTENKSWIVLNIDVSISRSYSLPYHMRKWYMFKIAGVTRNSR